MNEQTSAPRIVFIGCGNMGASLIGGLLAAGHPAGCLHGVEPDAAKRERLQKDFGIDVQDRPDQVIATAAAVVLAVKPQVMRSVVTPLGPAIRAARALVISVAAGVRSDSLQRWLGDTAAIVRAMPNTPALIRAGATGLYANPAVTPAQRQLAETVLGSVGLALWLEREDLIDAVTAISGSGPAYFFLFMEALTEAGTRLGLAPDQARQLALQTAHGAAVMALQGDADPGTLRTRVTSPGGTTERALQYFAEHGFTDLVAGAASAACDRARELGDELDRS